MAALKWIDYDFYTREKHVPQVLSCVRFNQMSVEELLACFHPPVLPGILEIPEVLHMLLCATCYAAARIVGKQDSFLKYQQRPRKYLLEGETMLWYTLVRRYIYYNRNDTEKISMTPVIPVRRYNYYNRKDTEKISMTPVIPVRRYNYYNRKDTENISMAPVIPVRRYNYYNRNDAQRILAWPL
ncbi:KLHL7 [Cordylochernes scorpioides]|uniref:KLHL7 n=1 Tax=Cordylochernes scorpioides TaxID=51811 RepID=A0ABY6JY05_9ARAC|nr:KLHL7 [Cordylochernes scorpioides]